MSLVCAREAFDQARVPIPVAFTHVPAALFVCVRQTPSGLPTVCWQDTLVPLQVSVVQRLPSSVHAVPFAFLASLGHA